MMSSKEYISSLLVFLSRKNRTRKNRQQFNYLFEGGHNAKVVLERQGNEGPAPLLNSMIQNTEQPHLRITELTYISISGSA